MKTVVFKPRFPKQGHRPAATVPPRVNLRLCRQLAECDSKSVMVTSVGALGAADKSRFGAIRFYPRHPLGRV